MPLGTIGYSFSPSQDIAMNGTGVGGRRAGASSPASAVEVRNLRLPSRENPRAPAPQALLQSQGSAGAPAGFDPQFINLLTRAFQVPAAGGPVLPPSQSVSQLASRGGGGGFAGPMTRQPEYRAPSNPFAPAAPAIPEFVGDVPQAPPSLFSPRDMDVFDFLGKFRSGYDPNNVRRTASQGTTHGAFLPTSGQQQEQREVPLQQTPPPISGWEFTDNDLWGDGGQFA